MTGVSAAVSNATSGATKAVSDATGATGLLEFFKELFSVNTAVRFIAVFIGVSFLIVAVVALVSGSKTVQQVAATAAKAAI